MPQPRHAAAPPTAAPAPAPAPVTAPATHADPGPVGPAAPAPPAAFPGADSFWPQDPATPAPPPWPPAASPAAPPPAQPGPPAPTAASGLAHEATVALHRTGDGGWEPSPGPRQSPAPQQGVPDPRGPLPAVVDDGAGYDVITGQGYAAGPAGEGPWAGVREELVARQLAGEVAEAFPLGPEAIGGTAGVAETTVLRLPWLDREDGDPRRPGADGPGPGAHRPTRRRYAAARAGLRVLDAGVGLPGLAPRLAHAGHLVTAVCPDPSALDEALRSEPPQIGERIALITGQAADCGRWFGPGSFDIVLCHGVLEHLPDPGPLLASLARMLSPGGLLSVLVRNADALAVGPAAAEDWTAALAAFDTDRGLDEHGRPVRGDRRAALERTFEELVVPVRSWFGVQALSGTRIRGPHARPPEDGRRLLQLLAAEERAGRQDPYRTLAEYLHVVGARPGQAWR